MSLSYEVTNWENGKTVLKSEHLRKIEKGITDIISENDAIYKDEDTRKSNEKQRQEEHSRKMNEASEVVSNIQKDYDSLQKIIIDENASANLQKQINSVNSQLEHNVNVLRLITNDYVYIEDFKLEEEEDYTNAFKRCIGNNKKIRLLNKTYEISDYILDASDKVVNITIVSDIKSVIKQTSEGKGIIKSVAVDGNNALNITLKNIELNGNRTSGDLIYVDSPGLNARFENVDFCFSGKSGYYVKKWTPYNYAFSSRLFNCNAKYCNEYGFYINGQEQGQIQNIHSEHCNVGFMISGIINFQNYQSSFNNFGLDIRASGTGIPTVGSITGIYSEASNKHINIEHVSSCNLDGVYILNILDNGVGVNINSSSNISFNGTILISNNWRSNNSTAIKVSPDCTKINLSGSIPITDCYRGIIIEDDLGVSNIDNLNITGERMYKNIIFDNILSTEITNTNVDFNTGDRVYTCKGQHFDSIVSVEYGAQNNGSIASDHIGDHIFSATINPNGSGGYLYIDSTAIKSAQASGIYDLTYGWQSDYFVFENTSSIKYHGHAYTPQKTTSPTYIDKMFICKSYLLGGHFDIDTNGDGLGDNWIKKGNIICELINPIRIGKSGKAQRLRNGNIDNYIYQDISLEQFEDYMLIVYTKGDIVICVGEFEYKMKPEQINTIKFKAVNSNTRISIYAQDGAIDDLAVFKMKK